MIKLPLLAIFVFCGLLANAQTTDRVIAINNDTIPCIINQSPLTAAFKYRTTPKGKAIKITPDKIKEFYTGDKAYWYKRVFRKNDAPMFMTVVALGKICLYEADIYYSDTDNSVGMTQQWYVSKNGSDAIMVKNMGSVFFSGRNKREKQFGSLLADNKAVYNQYVADDDFTVDEIKKLVQLYNK